MSSSSQLQQIASYSKAVSQPRNILTPDRDQAILFNTLENCTINDYLEGLSQHIEPRNIIFASRISNGRICIYLSSKNLVDKFIAETKKIKVNGNILEARRLITPSVRLIMSGVCPSIPSNLIKDELIKLGLNPLSDISYLRIGATNPAFSHILSFRRQIFISPLPDNFVLPESFFVELEQTSYRIFIAQNDTCFKCKLTGHQAANCPNISSHSHPYNDNAVQTEMKQTLPINHTQQDNPQNTPTISNTIPSTPTMSSQTPSQTEAIPHLSINTTQQPPLQNTSIHLTTSSVNTTIATPTSSESSYNIQKQKSTSPEASQNLPLNKNTQMNTHEPQITSDKTTGKRTLEDATSPPAEDEFEKPKLQLMKKTKTDDKNLTDEITNLKTFLEPVREYLEKSETQLLNFDQVVDLFENIQGAKDIISITKLYSDDSQALIKFLTELHPYYTDKRMKNKSTRLRKKLGKYIGLKTSFSGEDSDSSISSSKE